MKLSISWIFDHLNASWKECDISTLVTTFNTTAAEIEYYYKVNLDLSLFSAATVTEVKKDTIKVFSPEWNAEFSFEHRPDASIDKTFLITRKGWATIRDFNGEKEGLLPAIALSIDAINGSWKDSVETEDYILVLDNKSITHRPDMWSHRGFAREIGAMLDLTFKPNNTILEYHAVRQYEEVASATPKNQFAIQVKNHTVCKHFAGLYIEEIENADCNLKILQRLIKVDTRPMNAIVDLTNYVMLDIGQPMHAFDAAKIPSKKIEPRLAQQKEKLELLDGHTVDLLDHDLVITDGKKPLALAGIMGGKETAITADTESVFLEAACFDAVTIRKTSTRLKLRTEASARFEKSLDPNLNVSAIQRFLKLAHDTGLTLRVSDDIVSVGRDAHPQVIEITHPFIESRLGVSISFDQVRTILEKIEFAVREHSQSGVIAYSVAVPTFRGTKDVLTKEDILEEIARFYGYKTIPLVPPQLACKPHDIHALEVVRAFKQQLAFACAMHEVRNYAFYDEEFMHKLGWHPTNAAELQNPVSEHWKMLVTSLVPHLLKNVYQNQAKHEHLRFFECDRIWHRKGAAHVNEMISLAGIISDRNKEIDFYDAKQIVVSLFAALSIPVTWTKALTLDLPWYHPHQTAYLMHGKEVIGYAGKANTSFINKVIEGDAFIFEISGEFLLRYHPTLKTFKPLTKYPDVWLDISMLVPWKVTVDLVQAAIAQTDKRITTVALIDFFEKEEWAGKRSLTFRYVVQDPEKTLEKDEIDSIAHAVVRSVEKLGVTVR